MSHGESFLSVADAYLAKPGFYCLDEPEAALSFSSTLAMLGILDGLVANGSQVLCRHPLASSRFVARCDDL